MNRRLGRFSYVTVAVLALVVARGGPAWADYIRDKQWHLSFLRIADAQKYTQGAGVVVAVVDSGVDATHPDVVGSVLPGTDVEPGATGNGQNDTFGHGTAMAALIAGHGHGPGNADGLLGIAPQARILPVKDGNKYFGTALGNGIEWAVAHGARVISISQGGSSPLIGEQEAINDALAHDIVVVAGAGNTDIAGSGVEYPAAYPGVVAVSGVDQQGNHADISRTGPQVVLSAPATNIPDATINHGYDLAGGTSDATAIVAGVAALVRAKYPNLSATEVVHRLTATATDKGPPGRDDVYGYGIVNPVAALTADVPPLAGPSPSGTASAAPQATTRTTPWLFVAIGAAVLVGAVLWLVALTRRRTPGP